MPQDNFPHQPDEHNSHSGRYGKLMWVLFWILALGFLGYYFQAKINHQLNPNQDPVSHSLQDGRTSVTLQRNRQGHYVTQGLMNGQDVILLLDTGATQISIPENVARRLDLPRGRSYMVSTANGAVRVTATRIKSLSIGGITLYDLHANINPGMSDNMLLLGMNALSQLEMLQQGNFLTLTK